MKRARKNLKTVCLISASILAGTMRAEEKKITLPEDNPMAELKPGRGADVARTYCAVCHSTDYIVRQPGRTEPQWEAEVKKMITVFGAPISDGDAKTIANYLADAYAPNGQSPALIPPGRSASKHKTGRPPQTPSEHTSPQK